jgi:hypothetical protein
LGVGLTTSHWKTLVTKSEEAIAGYFGWQKLLRKARAIEPMMMMMMMMMIRSFLFCHICSFFYLPLIMDLLQCNVNGIRTRFLDL